MDTIGAVLGPLLSLGYLYFYPAAYRTLFFIAFIPGCLAVVASFFLKEKTRSVAAKERSISFFTFFNYWKKSPAAYRKVVIGLLAFTLFNSSDVFLLLKAKQSGLSDVMVIGLYIFYNLVYALFAFPVGIIADRIGLKKIFLIGLSLFSVVYLVIGLSENLIVISCGFLLYGISAAATEGVARAWISNISDKKEIATAIGTFAGFQSIFSMLASTLAGMLWYQFGAGTVFIVTAVATTLIIAYFCRACNDPVSYN
jgi:MFS family permease